ncbi:UNVERIFIED_CONTAM: hypothetical protein HHA_454460 [Hammondia hammondi]|eukprot:XP_008887992.1 hypothetical protein HHA_454460 [Hammondia hammondi]
MSRLYNEPAVTCLSGSVTPRWPFRVTFPVKAFEPWRSVTNKSVGRGLSCARPVDESSSQYVSTPPTPHVASLDASFSFLEKDVEQRTDGQRGQIQRVPCTAKSRAEGKAPFYTSRKKAARSLPPDRDI